MGSDDAFDKAKWHAQSVEEYGLPEEHAFVHTGLFVAWCALNALWEDQEGDQDIIATMRDRRASPIALYEWNDGCFFPSMLNRGGEAFARAYFSFSGDFIEDYGNTLSDDLPSVFHVPNTWASYDRIAPVFQDRYRQFLNREGSV